MKINTQQGFTLFELLIILLISSTLLGLAIPKFTSSIASSQTSADTNTLYHLIQFARNHALTSKLTVTLCASTDQYSCEKTQDWSEKSILVFIDQNKNETIDTRDEQLRVYKLQNPNATLKWKAAFGTPYLQIKPSGTTHQNGTFYYCNAKHKRWDKAIIVNKSGRPYFGQDTNKDGIVENSSGKNISC